MDTAIRILERMNFRSDAEKLARDIKDRLRWEHPGKNVVIIHNVGVDYTVAVNRHIWGSSFGDITNTDVNTMASTYIDENTYQHAEKIPYNRVPR